MFEFFFLETCEPLVQFCGQFPRHSSNGFNHWTFVNEASRRTFWLCRSCDKPLETGNLFFEIFFEGEFTLCTITFGTSDKTTSLCS